MKIYAKYSSELQDFSDEGETNYETDELNKENMNEFRILFLIKNREKKE